MLSKKIKKEIKILKDNLPTKYYDHTDMMNESVMEKLEEFLPSIEQQEALIKKMLGKISNILNIQDSANINLKELIEEIKSTKETIQKAQEILK